MLACGRANVDDPVGAANNIHLMLHDEQRIAHRLQSGERAQQSLGIGGMEPGRRLVHHIDDPEEVGDHLGRQPQPLEFAGRQGWGAPLQRQIAEAEVEQHRQPAAQIAGDALDHQGLLRVGLAQRLELAGSGLGIRREDLREAGHGQAAHLGEVEPLEPDRQGFPAQPLAVAERAGTPIMKRAARLFIIALWVVAKLCVTWRWALEKVPI